MQAIPAEHRACVERGLIAVLGTAAPDSVERLPQGHSPVFRVRHGGHDLVLRVSIAAFRPPESEILAVEHAAQRGVAPEVLFADRRHGVLLQAFIAAKPLARHLDGRQRLYGVCGLAGFATQGNAALARAPRPAPPPFVEIWFGRNYDMRQVEHRALLTHARLIEAQRILAETRGRS